jgi:hypothetical protein
MLGPCHIHVLNHFSIKLVWLSRFRAVQDFGSSVSQDGGWMEKKFGVLEICINNLIQIKFRIFIQYCHDN